jgi:hypothetical protein
MKIREENRLVTLILFVSPNRSLWSQIVVINWLMELKQGFKQGLNNFKNSILNPGDTDLQDLASATIQMTGLF